MSEPNEEDKTSSSPVSNETLEEDIEVLEEDVEKFEEDEEKLEEDERGRRHRKHHHKPQRQAKISLDLKAE